MKRDSGIGLAIGAAAVLAGISIAARRGIRAIGEHRGEYRHMMGESPGWSRAPRRAGSPAMNARQMFREPQRRRELEGAQVLPLSEAAQPLFHRLARVPQGASVRLLLKSEAMSVPELVAARMVDILDAEPIEGADWYSYTVKTRPELYQTAARIKSARESYRQEFLQVGLFTPRSG